MRIGIIGLNHKLADLNLREKMAKICHLHFSLGQNKHEGHFFILLSTCNRTEIYFYSDCLAEAHSYLLSILRKEIPDNFDQKLYSYFGYDCFWHLCRVTAGLDSAILAETEIQGQVKAAYESVLQYIHIRLPYELHYLFQNSLTVGKKIRTSLAVKPGLPDLEHAIFQLGSDFFEIPHQTQILFVGASEINKKVMSFLKGKRFENLTLCNRTNGFAKELAEAENIKFVDWNSVYAWHEFDWIIFGTKAPNYVISRRDAPNEISRKLVIDLCVPRNVDPQIGQNKNIVLYNIDQLNRSLKVRRKTLNECVKKAEKMAIESSKQKVASFHLKQQWRNGQKWTKVD